VMLFDLEDSTVPPKLIENDCHYWNLQLCRNKRDYVGKAAMNQFLQLNNSTLLLRFK
jgi:hypothetical protein